MRRVAIVISMLLYMGCVAEAPDGDSHPLEGRVIGTAPNGLPVVDAETMAFDDGVEVSEQTQAVTTEPFWGYDEWSQGFAMWRQNDCLFRVTASHTTTFGSQYGEAGEDSSWFNVQNRHVNRALAVQPASGALNWVVQFPSGSPCNTVGRCTFFICIVEGTAWPRCVSSGDRRGATQEFDGDPWPAFGWKKFQMYYQAANGPGFPTTTLGQSALGENLYIAHTCIQ